MKATLETLLTSDYAVGALMKREIPAVAAFKLRKIAKVMGEEIKAYNETREEKLKQAADKDEDGKEVLEDVLDDKGEKIGQKYVISDDKLKMIDAELRELLSKEVEISVELLKVEDFGDAKISAHEIPDWIIE
jgi:hypothetical protein